MSPIAPHACIQILSFCVLCVWCVLIRRSPIVLSCACNLITTAHCCLNHVCTKRWEALRAKLNIGVLFNWTSQANFSCCTWRGCNWCYSHSARDWQVWYGTDIFMLQRWLDIGWSFNGLPVQNWGPVQHDCTDDINTMPFTTLLSEQIAEW